MVDIRDNDIHRKCTVSHNGSKNMCHHTVCWGLKPPFSTISPLQVCRTLGNWGRTLRSNGTSRTCSTSSISLERLRSGPLWFYLYAWPGIFPEQWLNTRWRRPLQPPLRRSRHGQCHAAPQRWDLKKDKERNKESRWRRWLVRWGARAEEEQKTDNIKQSKEEKDDYFQLVPALMSCCQSPLLSHHAVRAELPISLRIIKWRERGREMDTTLTQRASTGRHTFALQSEGKRKWKRDSGKKKWIIQDHPHGAAGVPNMQSRAAVEG